MSKNLMHVYRFVLITGQFVYENNKIPWKALPSPNKVRMKLVKSKGWLKLALHLNVFFSQSFVVQRGESCCSLVWYYFVLLC